MTGEGEEGREGREGKHARGGRAGKGEEGEGNGRETSPHGHFEKSAPMGLIAVPSRGDNIKRKEQIIYRQLETSLIFRMCRCFQMNLCQTSQTCSANNSIRSVITLVAVRVWPSVQKSRNTAL